MRAPRHLVVLAVLAALLTGCSGDSPTQGPLDSRLSSLERQNRKLERIIEELGRSQGRNRGVPQRVQTLESRLASLEQRLSIVERR